MSLELGEKPAPARIEGWTTRSDLLIPYAFESKDGKLHKETPVVPDEAHAARRYVCPECGADLDLKGKTKAAWILLSAAERRRRRRRHFAHRKKQSNCPFHGESSAHVRAKHRIRLAVCQWKRGEAEAPRYRVDLACGHGPLEAAFPEATAQALLEKRLRLEGGIIQPDVLLIDGVGDPVMAVEVLKTHRVPEEKEAKFGESFPVIEVAASVIIDEPPPWRTERAWCVPTKCSTCLVREAEEAERHRLEAEAAERAEAERRRLLEEEARRRELEEAKADAERQRLAEEEAQRLESERADAEAERERLDAAKRKKAAENAKTWRARAGRAPLLGLPVFGSAPGPAMGNVEGGRRSRSATKEAAAGPKKVKRKKAGARKTAASPKKGAARAPPIHYRAIRFKTVDGRVQPHVPTCPRKAELGRAPHPNDDCASCRYFARREEKVVLCRMSDPASI